MSRFIFSIAIFNCKLLDTRGYILKTSMLPILPRIEVFEYLWPVLKFNFDGGLHNEEKGT